MDPKKTVTPLKQQVRIVEPAPENQKPLVDAIDGLSSKFDQMLRLMDEQVHLQKVALLEDGNILRFNAHDAQKIALCLPDAQDDYVQRVILRNRTFYEARLLALVQALGIVNEKSTVCDVGANIGNHTVYFACIMKAARVLSFEPQAHCYETLRRNIELNGLEKRTVIHNCLVGAENGSGQMERFNSRNLGGTAFSASKSGDVKLVTLDTSVPAKDLAKLDLIKIDVEGMQIEVLKGAKNILTKRKPAIWVELLQRDDAYEETAAYLAEFGYKPNKIGPNDFVFQV